MLPVLMGLEGPSLLPVEVSWIRQRQPIGFVLFSRNIVEAEQTRSLTDCLRSLCDHNPIIAIDQEGGRVVRTIGLGLQFPSAAQLRHADVLIQERSARALALSLRLLGITMNLAPVLDLEYDSHCANALPGRYWGTSVAEVVDNARRFNRLSLHEGISTCAKHFPGMGRAQQDPHIGLPVVLASLDTLLEQDLCPFVQLANELPAIMAAHLLLPQIDTHPSSLSHVFISELLRNRLGYNGVVMTDDLTMGAITQMYPPAQAANHALAAGCDLVLICHHSLAHLNSWLESGPVIEPTSQTRLANFVRQTSRPLPWDSSLWQSCLLESQNLCRLCIPQSSSNCMPDSVVTHL